MATTNLVYTNPQKQNANRIDNSNRFKINQQALNMIAKNPTLGIGYIIGSMLGENYWGNKRNKRIEQADRYGRGEGAIGADENGVYGVNNNGNAQKPYYEGKSGTDWSAYNNALDSVPRTPAQANKSAVTLDNASTTGGMQTVGDYWNRMNNNSGYNPGNTTLFTNGVRDINNVIPGGVAGNAIGADANGVYGVPGANPGVFVDTARGIYPGVAGAGSAFSVANFPQKPGNMPTPYTDDQLKQIAGQNFTPEEQSRMMTADEQARMNALTQPPAQESSSGGSGLLGSVVNTIANEAVREQTPPPAAPIAPNSDQMRAIKGDTPAPEVYDYVPGYANPQDLNSGQAYLDDYRRRGAIDFSTLGNALSALVAPFERSKKRATGR